MFFVKYRDAEGKETAALYENFEMYKHIERTFDPSIDIIERCYFSTSCGDYIGRKSYIRDVAVQWSQCDSSGLYISDYARIANWFTTQGKRFGLLKEFRENGII